MFELLAQVLTPAQPTTNSLEGVLVPSQEQIITPNQLTPQAPTVIQQTPVNISPTSSIKPTFVLGDFNPKSNHPNLGNLVFMFNSSYDYGECLSSILYFVNTKEVSNNPCLTMVRRELGDELSPSMLFDVFMIADYRARAYLESPMEPTFGLQRMIAQQSGYMYPSNHQNQDMIRLAQ